MNLRNGAIVGAAVLATAAFAVQAATMTLYQDGKIVSTDLKKINGQLYVNVKDLTSYLGATVATSGDRVDITSPAAPTGLPQALAQEAVPAVAMPMNPLAIANPPPPPLPDQLTAGINGVVSFGGFDYKVTSIKYEDHLYKQQFDQREMKLHPQWKTDRLAIVYLTVQNTGSQAGQPAVPGSSQFTVFDSNNIGYAATDLDIRQEPQVVGNETMDYGLEYGMDYGAPATIIAPSGQIAYAVVGSIPKNATVKMIQFHLSPPSIPGVNAAPVTNPPTPPATTPGETPATSTSGWSINPSGADVTIHM